MAQAKEKVKKPFFTKENFANAFTKENIARGIFIALAAFSILAVFAIVVFVFIESLPAFREVGFFNFVFGTEWNRDLGKFGILPMICTSFVLTIMSVLAGGILGIFTAVFIVYYCPKKLKGIFNQIVNLLAGIPSIIFGYFGLSFLDGFLADIFNMASFSGLLLSSIVLSIMIVPTITSIAKNSLENVPMHYYEGSLALGNTRNQTVWKVCLPAAKNGLVSAVILGAGRAIGEAMAVQFLLGGGKNFPTGMFVPVTSLTTNIVSEFAYANGVHRSALIGTGFILLIFILIINLALWMIKRNNAIAGNSFFTRKFREGQHHYRTTDYKRTGAVTDVLWILSIIFSIFVVIALLAVIIFVIVNAFIVPEGSETIALSWDFLFGKSTNRNPTLAPAMIHTGLIILLSLVIALPLGIGAAIFLNEYSKRGSKFVSIIRLFIDTLAGVPSIIFGLFGAILFGQYMQMGYSLICGVLTIALVILPTIIRSTEQSLSEVPDSMREASYALGAGKVRTIFVVVLPQAIRGIITAVILSIGRIVGESAALIYTAGTSTLLGENGLMSSGGTFTVYIYKFFSEGKHYDKAYATAFVLLVLVLLINLIVLLIQWLFERDKTKPLGIVLLFNRLFRKKKLAAVAVETDGGDFSEINVSSESMSIPMNDNFETVKLEEEKEEPNEKD